MTEGIDVANYQDSDYRTKGLGFVFVKATEGSSYVNPKHAAQVATARAGGLVVGHYHFVRPGSMTAQADYFLAHARPAPDDVLAFDWEDTGVTGAQKDQWLRHVQGKAPGQRVVLYCNRDFWLHRDTTSYAADGLWIADPSAPKAWPRIESDWLFHQYSSAGGLDRNYTDLTAAQLRAWAAGLTQEDEMPTAQEIAAAVWAHTETAGKGSTPVRMGAVLGWMDTVHGNQNKLLAQAVAEAGALRSVIAAMREDGGLTVEQAEAAGRAGADAALAELGDALTTKES